MHKIFLLLTFLVCSITACKGDDADEDTGDSDTSIEIIEVEAEIEGVLSNVTVRQHEVVRTILIVAWEQEADSKELYIEFSSDNSGQMASPAAPCSSGNREEVILGVPENSEVTMRIVADGQQTAEFTVPNGSAPSSMPRPEVESYDESLASSNRWLFGTVDDSPSPEGMYGGPFWLYIIDREGRIVWYYADLADNPVIGFPRISRDGRYIYFGNRTPWQGASGFVNTVVSMTLDWEYFDEIDIPLWDNVDQTDEGTFLFNTRNCQLTEYLLDGTFRTIWDTTPLTGTDCYSNTVNWNPIDDTILMSFPYLNTVTEVTRESGDLVATYGDASGSYDFDPGTWNFDFQHYPNITDSGTLMVSSRIPGSHADHVFAEFEIDRTSKVLTEVWSYGSDPVYADAMGEAHYVVNGDGNILANYGTGGIIKEITQDRQVAWKVTTNNMMVGHCILIDDLYAINRGPE